MHFLPIHPVSTGYLTERLIAVQTTNVNFFLYRCEPYLICIDTGYGKSLIRRELCRLGIDPLRVSHLFLTHSDFDHADGVSLFSNARVYLSSAEAPLITHRMARVMWLVHNKPIPREIELLADEQVVTVGETTIRAIAVPGHTPGSMAYFLNNSILFSGDAFKLVRGQACALRWVWHMDSAGQEESIRKLARLEGIQLACTAHSGCTREFDRAMAAWKPPVSTRRKWGR
jgi:glyoxylase-like metal-dependent hydrolase (beta-lactamase superfamily II)